MDEAQKLYRRGNPETPRLAAEEIVGELADLQADVYGWVKRYPGHTATELERTAGVLGRTFGRRLNELEFKGLVVRGNPRRCSVTNRLAAIWTILD